MRTDELQFILEKGEGYLIEFKEKITLAKKDKTITSDKTSVKPSEKGSDKASVKTSDNLVALLKNSPDITIERIAEQLNITPRAVEMRIAKLKKNNIIQRIGGKISGYWKIINEEILSNMYITSEKTSVKGSDKASVNTSDKTSDNLAALLKNSPDITIERIAEQLNITPRAIEMRIAKLKKNNIIQRIGGKISGYWKIINEEILLNANTTSVKNLDITSDKASVKASDKTSVNLKAILKKFPDITIVNIADQLNITPRAVEMRIAKLKKNNIIQRIGGKKSGYWKIIDKNKL